MNKTPVMQVLYSWYIFLENRVLLSCLLKDYSNSILFRPTNIPLSCYVWEISLLKLNRCLKLKSWPIIWIQVLRPEINSNKKLSCIEFISFIQYLLFVSACTNLVNSVRYIMWNTNYQWACMLQHKGNMWWWGSPFHTL